MKRIIHDVNVRVLHEEQHPSRSASHRWIRECGWIHSSQSRGTWRRRRAGAQEERAAERRERRRVRRERRGRRAQQQQSRQKDQRQTNSIQVLGVLREERLRLWQRLVCERALLLLLWLFTGCLSVHWFCLIRIHWPCDITDPASSIFNHIKISRKQILNHSGRDRLKESWRNKLLDNLDSLANIDNLKECYLINL